MEAIIIIIAVILCVIAFFVGRKFASTPIENENARILEEKQQLEKDLQNYKIDIEKEKNKLNDSIQTFVSTNKQLASENFNLETSIKANKALNEQIQQEYQNKLQVIEDTKQLAEKAHQDKIESLDKEYKQHQEHVKHETAVLYDAMAQIKVDLDSLKATRAAAIEAAKAEQNIKENKDDYCLILPREEEGDIALLRNVCKKISKPRAINMAIWSAYYQPLAKSKFPKILGKQEVCGIYKITNQKTGECYIGQAVDVRKRWYEHAKAGLSIDTPAGNRLYAAMEEYGLDNFSFELLLECSQAELDKQEKYFIELYQANIFGYNGNAGVGK